jgi:YD repeat-containing protein
MADGALDTRIEYRYKYDDYGNLIEKITIKNGAVIRIAQRQVEYYKYMY